MRLADERKKRESGIGNSGYMVRAHVRGPDLVFVTDREIKLREVRVSLEFVYRADHRSARLIRPVNDEGEVLVRELIVVQPRTGRKPSLGPSGAPDVGVRPRAG